MTPSVYNAAQLAAGRLTPEHLAELVRAWQAARGLTVDGLAAQLADEMRRGAIAEALRVAPSGDVIEIHEEHCEGSEEPDPPHDVVGCTCTPMVLVAQGAEA